MVLIVCKIFDMEEPKRIKIISVVFCTAIIIPAVIAVVSDILDGQKPVFKGCLIVALLILLGLGYYLFFEKSQTPVTIGSFFLIH